MKKKLIIIMKMKIIETEFKQTKRKCIKKRFVDIRELWIKVKIGGCKGTLLKKEKMIKGVHSVQKQVNNGRMNGKTYK